jgi:hypothetical protein
MANRFDDAEMHREGSDRDGLHVEAHQLVNRLGKMKMKKFFQAAAALALCATVGVVSYAAVDVDGDGVGFVGKGDVQLALGWNNRKLQDNHGTVAFRANVATEYKWLCANNGGEHQKTTKTTAFGLVSYAARERNQITGFTLDGFNGTIEEINNGGLDVEECPGNANELVEGSLQVSDSGFVSVSSTVETGKGWVKL